MWASEKQHSGYSNEERTYLLHLATMTSIVIGVMGEAPDGG